MEMLFGLKNNCAIKVIVDNNLPIHETVQVFGIETRQELRLSTGKMVHCYRVVNDYNNTLIVSNEMYEVLKNIK